MIDAVATPKTALTLAVVHAASEINNRGSRLLIRLLSSQIDKGKKRLAGRFLLIILHMVYSISWMIAIVF
jgi:hypothetical protein